MDPLEEVKKRIKSFPDTLLSTIISKGVLRMDDNQIETLTFVYYLCFLVERDIGEVLSKPWRILEKEISKEVFDLAKRNLDLYLSLGEKRPLSIDNLTTFEMKIKVYKKIFSENNVYSVLCKIKNIRNDISHGRIHNLLYEGKSLLSKEIKEKLLLDYLEAVLKPDHTNSKLGEYLNLSNEQKAIVDKMLDKIEDKMDKTLLGKSV